jgi:hypothetical protein
MEGFKNITTSLKALVVIFFAVELVILSEVSIYLCVALSNYCCSVLRQETFTGIHILCVTPHELRDNKSSLTI